MTKSWKNSSFEDHLTTKVTMKKLLYSERIFLMNLSGMRRPFGFKNSSETTTTPGRKRSAVPLQISTHRHSRHPKGDAVLQITQKRKHRKDPRPHALI